MAKILQFKPILKDSYFYNKYRYCITFSLDEASVLKSLDHDYIDAIIERRKVWREISQQRWARTTQPLAGSIPHTILTKRHKEITFKTEQNLHDFAELLIKTSTDFKLVTSVNQGWIYTNTGAFIKKIDSLSYLNNKEYTEAVVSRPKNTIKLKNPVHTHRSYFKSIKLTSNQKQNLINFFNNHADIRLGPSFNKWLAGSPYMRTQDYFFIDHMGESWLVLLALIYPGIVRKTLEIIPA
jgi:hypothetical protein